jgi:hypothetical protein
MVICFRLYMVRFLISSKFVGVYGFYIWLGALQTPRVFGFNYGHIVFMINTNLAW